jgi:tRNA(fMet)-specific endonuclease VapC
METNLCLDTTFLIDLEREKRRPARATQFLSQRSAATLWIPVIAWGEFLEGEVDAARVVAVRASLNVLPITEEIAAYFARISRALRRQGKLIGANDLWIAATALERSLPLVTANISEFNRIAHLNVLGY